MKSKLTEEQKIFRKNLREQAKSANFFNAVNARVLKTLLSLEENESITTVETVKVGDKYKTELEIERVLETHPYVERFIVSFDYKKIKVV